MPKLPNCRIYGRGATYQELSQLPCKWLLGAIQVTQYYLLKIMGLDILSLATKSQWAFCEFLSKCFSLLTLFQSTWSLSVVTSAFSGPHGRRIIPLGVLTPGKGIGCKWTNVTSLLRLELSTSSMPSTSVYSVPGGQLHVKLWDFLLAILRRILISSGWRKTNLHVLE